MRTVLAKITDPKSGVELFIKLNPIGTCSKFSNEVLMILVVQGAAKLPKVKVGGLNSEKKFCSSASSICTTRVWPGFESQIFFQISNFDLW